MVVSTKWSYSYMRNEEVCVCVCMRACVGACVWCGVCSCVCMSMFGAIQYCEFWSTCTE